ncbi:helix-turn-helix transcriptional regulator [uncultured Microscilla sp.]|uniref:helix-turn-helix domain-containing protein n=1 Tax=uncultured Microscilla sp. TaxID=432653 RepID=UPI0026078786|nr:helix-turn-helix transcriptional regulator [uncultured Microscilla sp.]
MNTFGKRLAERRKQKELSQKELAKLLNTSHSTIGKYEREEMTPSVEAAKKLAKLLDTTVGYLLGETENADLFQDAQMLQRLVDLNKLPKVDKEHVLFTLDAILRDAKARLTYGS